MSHSARLDRIQGAQYQRPFEGWAPVFHRWLKRPPTHPLNPVNPDNARILRITAAAGTELADPYSRGTGIGRHVALILPPEKQFTTRRAVFLHAAWLVQASAHWPIFLTAASRRSLVRVSVRQLANGTHAHPPPDCSFTHNPMPDHGAMGY